MSPIEGLLSTYETLVQWWYVRPIRRRILAEIGQRFGFENCSIRHRIEGRYIHVTGEVDYSARSEDTDMTDMTDMIDLSLQLADEMEDTLPEYLTLEVRIHYV